jgi:hypothetical protein
VLNPEATLRRGLLWQSGERLRRLPCGHSFHAASCIDVWLRNKNACPLCQAPPVPV